MAAGDAFAITPNVAIPVEPDYHNIVTPSESMKKEYLNMSATPTEKWILKFKALTSTNMNVLLTHYKENSGEYYPFSWTTVPPHINSGANITGRWVKGSLSLNPISGIKWMCQITFEKAN